MDDCGSIQPAIGHLNSTLGFHMKTSKQQPPQHEHKIQGVYIHTDSTHITIKPCQQRIQQITTTLQQAIDTNSLEPSLAQKLAGKCAFTATQLFGKVGRAANRALYDHAFSNYTHLDKPTKQGILAMINILQHAQPRVAPLVPHTFQPTTIYTGAYYQIDGVHKRCCDLTEEDLQHAHKDLGDCRILSRQTANCYQWPCPAKLASPVHILPCFYLLPRSLDSRHRTSFISPSPDTTLHPTVRQ